MYEGLYITCLLDCFQVSPLLLGAVESVTFIAVIGPYLFRAKATRCLWEIPPWAVVLHNCLDRMFSECSLLS